MMKEQYSKPDIDAKAYAQFENVFTACNKNSISQICSYSPAYDPSGPNGSSHINLRMS